MYLPVANCRRSEEGNTGPPHLEAPPPKPKMRIFCVTINNPTEVHTKCIERFAHECHYICWCLEIGKEGTPHFQMYVETIAESRYTTVGKALGKAHAKGSDAPDTDDARDYCMHQGKHKDKGGLLSGPWEIGKYTRYVSRQGDRMNLIMEDIKNKASDRELMIKHPENWMRYEKSIKRMRALYHQREIQERSSMTRGLILLGTTGVGKTTVCYNLCKDMGWTKPWCYPGRGWFDGYQQNELALFNEYTNDLGAEKMLELIDQFPMDVPIKNDFVNWNPIVVVITCNHPFWTRWPSDQMEALMRRCAILEITKTKARFIEVDEVKAKLGIKIDF